MPRNTAARTTAFLLVTSLYSSSFFSLPHAVCFTRKLVNAQDGTHFALDRVADSVALHLVRRKVYNCVVDGLWVEKINMYKSRSASTCRRTIVADPPPSKLIAFTTLIWDEHVGKVEQVDSECCELTFTDRSRFAINCVLAVHSSPSLLSLSVHLCNYNSPLTIVTDCSARGYDVSKVVELTSFLNMSALGDQRLVDVVPRVSDQPDDSAHQLLEVVREVGQLLRDIYSATHGKVFTTFK